jgi:hypothetical protein
MADLLMKKFALFLIPIFVVYFYFNSSEEAPFSNKTSSNKKVVTPLLAKKKNFITKKYPPVPIAPVKRIPASAYVKRSPAKKLELALAENPIRIGKSFQVVPNVLSMNIDEYQNEFGKIVSRNEHYVFFEPKRDFKAASPAAYDTINNKLYPISHILHVKGVDGHLRSQFKAQGLNEYYYHSRLKLISLETTPQSVLAQYQKLTSQGFDVRLEVIKEAARAN